MWYIKNVQGWARKMADPEIFTVGWLPQTERNVHQGVLCFSETNVFCLSQRLMSHLLKWGKWYHLRPFFSTMGYFLSGSLRVIMDMYSRMHHLLVWGKVLGHQSNSPKGSISPLRGTDDSLQNEDVVKCQFWSCLWKTASVKQSAERVSWEWRSLSTRLALTPDGHCHVQRDDLRRMRKGKRKGAMSGEERKERPR